MDDEDSAGLSRRAALGRLAAGAGIAWSTPVLLSSPAAAQGSAAPAPIIAIAPGNNGALLVSTDFVNWSTGASGTASQLIGAIRSGGNWVLVGASTVARTSPDAVTWTGRTIASTQAQRRMADSGTRLVSVGFNGEVFDSTDNGVTWNTQTALGISFLQGIVYDGGKFVIAANGGIYTSATGTSGTWTVQTNGGGDLPVAGNWATIAHSGSLFLVTGGLGRAMVSATAASGTWTDVTANTGTTNALNGAAFGDGKFVVVGSGGIVLTTVDGTSFTAQTSNTTSALFSVRWTGSNFVAVGDAVITSPDGVTWTAQIDPVTDRLFDVAFT